MMKRRLWIGLLFLFPLVAILFSPIRGQVLVTPDDAARVVAFPQIRMEPHAQTTEIVISDNVGWSNVGLAVNGQLYPTSDWKINGGIVTWRWEFPEKDMRTDMVFITAARVVVWKELALR